MDRDRSIYNSFSKRKENVYRAPRRNETLNKEIDFPDIGFLSGPTNDTSNNILTYEHIQDLNENDCSNDEFKPGWIYGSIHSETNKPVWVDKSKTSIPDNSLFDFTALDEWCARFEKECEDFINEYGYDEYLRYYCISCYEIEDEFEGGEDYSEAYDDDNYDGSDEEF
jgi:hypothetical protein